MVGEAGRAMETAAGDAGVKDDPTTRGVKNPNSAMLRITCDASTPHLPAPIGLDSTLLFAIHKCHMRFANL